MTATPMGDEGFKVHMGYTRLGENQVVLLCSDGGMAHLRDEETAAEVVAARRAGEDPGDRLVERVRERGASDNATVVVVTLERPQREPSRRGDRGRARRSIRDEWHCMYDER